MGLVRRGGGVGGVRHQSSAAMGGIGKRDITEAGWVTGGMGDIQNYAARVRAVCTNRHAHCASAVGLSRPSFDLMRDL